MHMVGVVWGPTRGVTRATADCGGSNGSRTRLWKTELQKLADQTGLEIVVCHFPPGTSKWNKTEHRLFSFISKNWRGQPLVSYELIINLIAATSTSTSTGPEPSRRHAEPIVSVVAVHWCTRTRVDT
jgi:hypothetical protein